MFIYINIQESIANWAAACPPGPSMHDVEGGAQARAAAAAKAGNHRAAFLALAYGQVSSRVATAAEVFETKLSFAEGARRSAAAATRRKVVLEGPDGLLGDESGAVVGGGGERGSHFLRPPPPLQPSPPPPPPLSRLAALKWEDIEGRRILLHVDLSRGVAEGDTKSSDGGDVGVGAADGGGNGGSGAPVQPFPEAVRLVAEQVREMLSAKPAAVAIISEMAPPSAAKTATPTAEGIQASSHTQLASPPVNRKTIENDQRPSPTSGAPTAAASPPPELSCCCSLRPSAAAIASLLGMEVDFYESIPDLAAVLERCVAGGSGTGRSAEGDGGGGTGGIPPAFGMVPLMMVERLSLPGVVPAPPVEEPELSDGEEERLPDFSWGGKGVSCGALQWRARIGRYARAVFFTCRSTTPRVVPSKHARSL